MKKFFSGLLVMILIVEILGGIGYAGYSMLFMGSGHGSMSMANNTSQNNITQSQTSVQENSSSHGSMNMQSAQGNTRSDSMNMQNGSVNAHGGSMNMQAQTSGQSTLQQVNYALQNKESVDKAISMLNDIAKSISMGAYSTGSPDSNTVNNAANMGISYDTAKMEQFHTGLYKITVGIEKLKQLEEELMKQAEKAAVDVKDKTAYYTNQYNMTLQSKSKLSQALYDIDASNLLNINPYISSNGAVYDKDRMQQVHGNTSKLAQSATILNKLNSDMTRQAVTLIGTAQSYANTSSMDMSSMNMSTPGMFGSISMPSVINILLIVFAGAFVIGLIGFISSLFKPSTPQFGRN